MQGIHVERREAVPVLFIVDERPGIRVVEDKRPELLDRHIFGNLEFVELLPVYPIACFVEQSVYVDIRRRIVVRTRIVSREEVAVGPHPHVDTVVEIVREVAVFVRCQNILPLPVFPVLHLVARMGQHMLHVVVKIGSCLTHRLFGHRIGMIGFAFFYAEVAQVPHHDLVLGLDVFISEDIVDIFEERFVVMRQCRKTHVGRIDERCRFGIVQIVHLDLFAVSVSVGHGCPGCFDGAKREIDTVTRRLEHIVAFGNIPLVMRRQQQVLAALAFVHTDRAHVGDGPLPVVDDLSVKQSLL